ncbi:MAG: hypothetical protein AB2L14_37275 [Candidatus Xenobiia bacterium LiM19]
MVFIESDEEKQRKHLIDAYKKVEEDKKRELFAADLEKATGLRDVKAMLARNKEVEVVITDQGFPPHIMKDDAVFIKSQEPGKYRKNDFILYEGSGKIRFGLIKKISRASAGGNVTVEYAKCETELVKEKNILGQVIQLDRFGRILKLRAGFMGWILELLGY